MDTSRWSDFPHPDDDFRYPGGSLKKAWQDLHRGDCEPWPEDKELQEAWRCFHAGDFAGAVERADRVGIAGHAVANKASGIYADYLEDDDSVKIAIYNAGIERAEKAIKEMPDDPNAHYFHAFLLGRYSQSISVAKALAQGVGGRIKASLDRALELEPKHAEAWTALGLYHAEIIDKVGKLVGRMTYGASADAAHAAFDKALSLTPDAPIAHIEYGNGLYLLYGDKQLEESNEAYAKAVEITPIDAMQKLDIEYARASLE